MFKKQSGTRALQSGACPGRNRAVLTRTAAADDVHGRQLRAFELCNIPDMSHVGEVCHGHFDWERFDLRRPYRRDPVSYRCQRKAADAVEQAAHRQLTHAAAAFATVFVILIAVCAV